MKIKYFADTDTLYVQFNDKEVIETKDLDQNTLVDIDKSGNLVGMTIEHASQSATLSEFTFQQMNPGFSAHSLHTDNAS